MSARIFSISKSVSFQLCRLANNHRRLPSTGISRFMGLGNGASAQLRTVDLRSDTVTKPGPAMRKVMMEAQVGDDGFGDDPTVNELQKLAAEKFGMEATLFVPSGTMGNLISVMVHCRQRGDEMIVGDLSHLHIYEQGGSAQLAGVHSIVATTLSDGTFDFRELEAKIHYSRLGSFKPRACLVCVENTHNVRGGCPLPISFLQELRAFADQYDLAVHMDGARLMNAVVAQGTSASSILKHCDTVCVALSKGLGAPAGTLIGGSRDFIQRAVLTRRALGGIMRQSGILAAAGIMALTHMVDRLQEDHQRAKTFSQILLQGDPPLYEVDMATPETNIVRFRPSDLRLRPADVCYRAADVCEDEARALGQAVRVLLFPIPGGAVRAVLHLDITDDDIMVAVEKLRYLALEHKQQVRRIGCKTALH